MIDVETVLDFELLEQTSPEYSCESAGHSKETEKHGQGPGFYYLKIVHNCDVRTIGEVFLICEKFGNWIKGRPEEKIFCFGCHYTGLVKDWAVVIGSK